jgi:predicted glutamine amidotransferase
MCRLLVFSAVEPAVEIVKELVESLVAASKEDPHLFKVSGGRFSSHDDGWGYAVIGEWIEGGKYVMHYRSGTPIYEDLTGLYKLENTLERSHALIGLAHSRKASRGFNRTYLDAHPMHAIMDDGSEIWVAHNGSLDIVSPRYKLLLPDLGEGRPDTLSLTKYLAGTGALRLMDALRLLIRDGLVKTALSLGMLLAVEGREPEAIAINYNVFEGKDRERADYYRMYRLADEGIIGVASSTVVEKYGGRFETLRNGEYVTMKVIGEGADKRISADFKKLEI